MIADLKPYSAMKDSGVEWLGEVPEHWGVLPNRALFDEIKDRDRPDEQMLSVTIKKGVIKQASLLEDTSKKDSSNLDRSNYKLLQPGDIAYNKMRAWQGAIGASDHRGIISPAYVVQRPRESGEPSYFHHLFRIPQFAKEAERWSYGITSDMWSLRPEHFKLIYSCLPPLNEQATIVRYLDHVDRRVRRLTRAKRKLIALLTEQKQAIIHRAVTRGLDPDVPLKDSGVEGALRIPAHWKVARASSVTKFFNGKAHEQFVEDDAEFICVTARFVSTGGVADRRCTANHCPAQIGDVLMVMSDLPRGRALARSFLVDMNNLYAVNQRVCILRPTAIEARFLSYYVNRHLQLLAYDDGSNQTHLPSYAFKILRLLLPPDDEQVEIAEYLDEVCKTIESKIAVLTREVELLNEYRTSLIADVVTGKLDVRDAAAALPEVDPLAEDDNADDLETETDESNEALEEVEA